MWPSQCCDVLPRRRWRFDIDRDWTRERRHERFRASRGSARVDVWAYIAYLYPEPPVDRFPDVANVGKDAGFVPVEAKAATQGVVAEAGEAHAAGASVRVTTDPSAEPHCHERAVGDCGEERDHCVGAQRSDYWRTSRRTRDSRCLGASLRFRTAACYGCGFQSHVVTCTTKFVRLFCCRYRSAALV